uniref:Gentian CONSTANS-like16 homolog n=1 Tax=Gentiana triflora TaxID=55190 RepID=A0A0K2SFT8_GENTR|nr:gentian CONSTANS-like16 homolog [Gentiana triflora]
MTNTQSKTANIIGGKTARACDSCLRKRARWFCAADDAFLCQSCDTSVHSANLLASRHERVRLETASWKNNIKQQMIIKLSDDVRTNSSSCWHQGFTKKPRTPRSRRVQQQHDNKDDDDQKKRKPLADLVPEISSNEDENEEERELLLYRVPVLGPFATDQICSQDVPFDITSFKDDFDAIGMGEIPGFISTDDIELQELNSLLGNEIEEDSCGIKGLLDNNSNDCFEDNMLLKIEEENQEFEGGVMESTTASESFNWDFDYSKSPIPGDLDEDLRIMSFDFPTREDFEMMNIGKETKKLNLKINYEQVIAAWDCQVCPWTNGVKPDFNPDDCWPDFMETGSGIDTNGENVGNRSGHGGGCWDREREARVLRYKEKRRKRLFAKKIRYEVRKLNAEKRPRLKGRFVKRTSFVPSSSLPTSCYMMKQ